MAKHHVAQAGLELVLLQSVFSTALQASGSPWHFSLSALPSLLLSDAIAVDRSSGLTPFLCSYFAVLDLQSVTEEPRNWHS